MSDLVRFDYGPKRGGVLFGLSVMSGAALALAWGGVTGGSLGPMPAWVTAALALPAVAVAWQYARDLRASRHRTGSLRLTPQGLEKLDLRHPGRVTRIPHATLARGRLIKVWNQEVFEASHDNGRLTLTSGNFNDHSQFEAFLAATTAQTGP